MKEEKDLGECMKIKITATYRVDLYDPKIDHWARASEQTEKDVLSLHNLRLSEVLYESSVSDYIERKRDRLTNGKED